MLLNPCQTRQLFDHAVRRGYAILAVNADSPAAITDCLLAASQSDAPIIVESSLWQLTGHSFGTGDPILGIDRYLANLKVLGASSAFANVPLVFHTDHIKGAETMRILKHAISRKASSVSLDSSELSHDQNVTSMNELCSFAKDHDLSVSLEIEAGVDDGVTPLDEVDQLFGAVERAHPGCLSLWAPGVGTKHGLGAATGFDPCAVKKHQERASELGSRPIGIALHGSSGLSDNDLIAGVQAGVAKVNWSSESLLIRSSLAARYYQEYASQLEKGHADFKSTAMDNGVQRYVSSGYVRKVTDRIAVLNGAGKASEFLNSLTS